MSVPEPDSPTFTIFTPTLDRAAVLHRVYDSLAAQTYRSFEWLVIDNGSSDGTQDLVREWAMQADFPVRFFQNETNIGFQGSWKRAIDEACGELFLYARSADEMPPNALERFKWHWDSIPDDQRSRYSAVTGLTVDERGTLHGHRFPRDVIDSNATEMTFRYRVTGEKFGFQRTDVLREVVIPDIPGFLGSIPPSVTWREIGRRYRTRYVNEVLRVYWQDQTTSLSQPKVAWRNAPGRLVQAEDTLAHDLRWLPYAPIPIFREVVAYVNSSLHVGRGIAEQWRALPNTASRAAWVAALPAGIGFFLLQSRWPRLARRLPCP